MGPRPATTAQPQTETCWPVPSVHPPGGDNRLMSGHLGLASAAEPTDDDLAIIRSEYGADSEPWEHRFIPPAERPCFLGCTTGLAGLGAGGAGGPGIEAVRWCAKHREEGLAEVERRYRAQAERP